MMLSDPLAQDILAADEARYQALYAQDLEALDTMLHRDYVHVHANAKREDKLQFIDGIKQARYRFVSADRQNQCVRLVRDCCLLSGDVTTTIVVGEARRDIRNAFLTVWTRADDRWQLVHWQATPIPPVSA